MSLPAEYSIRHPRPEDAAAAAAVMTAADEGAEEVTAEDLAREWHELDLANDVWVIEDEEAIVACAGLLKRGDDHVASEGFVDPGHVGCGLGSALLELIEERAGTLVPTGRLTNGVLDTNQAAIALLEGRGYHAVRHFFRMLIELEEPPPKPRWPEGLQARAFEREHAEAFHEAIEEAFVDEWGRGSKPFEEFRRLRLDAPGSSPELWVSVWDGNELAATLICDARRYEMGWIASVGVRPAWRRRGLGLALLHHAFAEFWRRGERIVGLGVDAENPTGATRLYERAGMRVVFDAVVYEKPLS